MDPAHALLRKSEEAEYYMDLVLQLQSDFSRSGVSQDFLPEMAAEELVKALHTRLASLYEESPQRLQQLLYVVDIPEAETVRAMELPFKERTSFLSYLVLKRCKDKVFTRRKFS